MTKQEELQLKRELKETKDKVKTLKQKIYDITNEQDEEKIKLQDLAVELQSQIETNKLKHSNEITDLTQKLSSLEEEIKCYKEEINNYQYEVAKREDKIQQQRKKIQTMNDQNHKIYLVKKYIKKCKDLSDERKTKEKLEKTLSEYISNGKMDGYQKIEWLVVDAIKYLESKLSIRTVHLYDLGKINKKVGRLKDKAKKNKPKKNIANLFFNNYMFGIINEELNFLDNNGVIYEISEFVHGDLSNYIDNPCKAFLLKDGTVSIPRIYSKHGKILSIDKKLTKKREKDDKNTKPQYDKKLKVLIVGSCYKEKYCKAISSYGLNYIWFDSFVNSPVRLRDLYKTCDIAILLKDHMSHAVLDVIDTNDNKVAVLGKDTESSVVSTVNYLINKNDLSNLCVD